MTAEDIISLTKDTDLYNLHSHTQFCDGRASMEDMAAAARRRGMKIWGISPHAPICVDSPCNMLREDVGDYISEADRLKEFYAGEMKILTGMEVDYVGRDFGAHIDYFQKLPLDYRIGSVHFVPNQDGIYLDCDGKFERFDSYLRDGFENDLRYVVEKFFEQTLEMIELGGFEILGHFDKIAGNAAMKDPGIENTSWYEALVDDVIRHASWAGIAVEINTKSLFDKNRFFPAERWWRKMKEAGLPLVINSDAHYPEKVNLGREEAFKRLREIK